jgi:hypothetical protein
MQTTREMYRPETHAADAPLHDSTHPTAQEARQGVVGHNVRYVLAISLAGALIVLTIAWFVVT